MKITNISNKTVFLLDGKTIKPKQTIDIDLKEGSDLHTQILALSKIGNIEIN